MTKTELYHVLDYVDHSRQKRMQMANLVSENPNVLKPLLEIAFDDSGIISSRACWVLEFTIKRNIAYLFPFLDTFTAKLGYVQLDSSVRPIAKICEILTKDYFSKKFTPVQNELTDEHLERIATACFDWLIGNHKVAPKAYSMTSLLLLGKKFDWVLPELKMVLEQNYVNGSAAYKARARMTLAKIK